MHFHDHTKEKKSQEAIDIKWSEAGKELRSTKMVMVDQADIED